MTAKNKAVFGVYEISVQAEKAVDGISAAGFCETSEEIASAKYERDGGWGDFVCRRTVSDLA